MKYSPGLGALFGLVLMVVLAAVAVGLGLNNKLSEGVLVLVVGIPWLGGMRLFIKCTGGG